MQDTSRAAFDAIRSEALELGRQCFDVLKRLGPQTADEVATRLQQSVLSIRPRFTELKKDGAIVATEVRRKNRSGRSAIVWRVAA